MCDLFHQRDQIKRFHDFLRSSQICDTNDLLHFFPNPLKQDGGPPRDFGEQGNQGNKCLQMRGIKAVWGNIGNQYFDSGEQENKAIYFRGTREQIPRPHLGGPQDEQE